MTATKPDQEVSPTLARAMYLLRQEIYGYLDEDERFMDLNMWDDEDVALAQELVPALTFVLRNIVAKHKVAPNGTCTECGEFWPCPLINYVHTALHDPNQPHVAVQRKLNESD